MDIRMARAFYKGALFLAEENALYAGVELLEGFRPAQFTGDFTSAVLVPSVMNTLQLVAATARIITFGGSETVNFNDFLYELRGLRRDEKRQPGCTIYY